MTIKKRIICYEIPSKNYQETINKIYGILRDNKMSTEGINVYCKIQVGGGIYVGIDEWRFTEQLNEVMNSISDKF